VRNFYKVLGIRSTADELRIKSAFRRRAKAVHPDLNPGDKQAEHQFRELTQAYEVLRNARARASYDAFLAERRSRVRRRVAGSGAVMVSTFILTLGSAYTVLALHDTGIPSWESSRQALAATASTMARRIDSAVDAIAHAAATILNSATPQPAALHTPRTEVAKAPLPSAAAAASEAASKQEQAKPAAKGGKARVEPAKSASVRKPEREALVPAKARKKVAAATPKRSPAVERGEAAAQFARPTDDTNRPWPTADEPFMALGATRR
jgi:hypothetical protein